jgi:sigma-B regulation protein RsbU (phosphoserine phosphatase)
MWYPAFGHFLPEPPRLNREIPLLNHPFLLARGLASWPLRLSVMLAVDPPRMLIADDQPDVLEALRLLLKGAGFQTESVTSPSAALEALKASNYDLLLMDLNYARDTTSGREGIDLLTNVRKIDQTLPVVVITAWGTLEIAVEALRNGVTDFILKPWENAQLVSALRKHVEAGRSARRTQRMTAEHRLELEDARVIQERLIPIALPELPGYSIAAAWHPAHTVGGDYYDVLRLGDHAIAICIADVSGKGMPAALLMSNVQAALRAYASEGLAPAELCARLNRVVSSNTDADRFISLFYCVLDTKTGKLVYSNAGHNPPVLVRPDGSVARLECGGLVLGPLPEVEFEQCEIDVNPGDRILLFTDGVTEAMNGAGEEFGDDRLIQAATESRTLDANQARDVVMAAVTQFSGGDFTDDVTLVVAAAK